MQALTFLRYGRAEEAGKGEGEIPMVLYKTGGKGTRVTPLQNDSTKPHSIQWGTARPRIGRGLPLPEEPTLGVKDCDLQARGAKSAQGSTLEREVP